jgi:DNA primase
LESINRVGPCQAKVTLEKIEDIRDTRRKVIIDRAKKILHQWNIETLPATEEVFKEVAETMKPTKVVEYSPEELTAGPDIENAKEIIIVEGRADVINLLKCGIKNVIALEGAKVPDAIITLCKEKEATAFLDGDRGGDLILKELLQVTDVKYITRAPPGKEVEEIGCKEIFNALQQKMPIEKMKGKRERAKVMLPKKVTELVQELNGTLEAILLDEKVEQIERLPVSELAEKLQTATGVDMVVFDGVITQRMVDIANEKSIKYLVAARVSEAVRQPLKVNITTFADVTPQ